MVRTATYSWWTLDSQFKLSSWHLIINRLMSVWGWHLSVHPVVGWLPGYIICQHDVCHMLPVIFWTTITLSMWGCNRQFCWYVKAGQRFTRSGDLPVWTQKTHKHERKITITMGACDVNTMHRVWSYLSVSPMFVYVIPMSFPFFFFKVKHPLVKMSNFRICFCVLSFIMHYVI